MSGALEHGLALAAQGIPIFFCNSDKSPACPRGFYAATSNAELLAELHRRHPGPLLGVPTGLASGFDVLDLDTKHATAAAWWKDYSEQVPTTRMHRTRSGGLHLFFRHAAGLRNSTSKIARGVDTRCDGGYVIWWPSVNYSVLCEAPIAEWPHWLLAELLHQPVTVRYEPVAGTFVNGRRLAGLVRTVAQATEGTRNSTLFWAVRRIANQASEESFPVEVLIEAAIRAGLPAAEARRTARSGLARA